MNGRRATRSSPEGADPPATPVQNVVMQPSPRSSSISDITTPSSGRRNFEHAANLLSLANLATNQQSPARRPRDPPAANLPESCDAMEEEDAHDRRTYYENAGASDSEDEDDLCGTEAATERHEHLESNLSAVPDDSECVESSKFTGEEPAIGRVIPGAPAGWKAPSAPKGWKEPKPAKGFTHPKFEDIDNPGGWSNFTHQAKCERKRSKITKCLCHALPTGVTPVPEVDGKREENGWEFHYNGWTHPEGLKHRSGATKEDPFPEVRDGCLDEDILKSLGLNEERMTEDDGAPDALFFYQLLFPICKTSGVEGDPRKFFYSSVAQWSNLYAIGELDLGNGTNHHHANTNPAELSRWDGVTVMDGARGGSRGAILRRWDASREDNAAFDKYISASMTKTRWLELKRVYKLCNNSRAPKRGEANYNPAYKCDFLCDVLVHNANAITKRACLDLCGDESSFPFGGFGEAETGLLGLIKNKPGIARGGQIVIVTDRDHLRPRACLHRHKKHDFDWTFAGCWEVKKTWQQLREFVASPTDGNDDVCRPKPLFIEKPHLTWDNYFSGDILMEHAAKEGFGLTTTVRRDRLPRKVPSKCMHKEKTNSMARPKAARFEQPIFMTKHHEGSLMQFTTFQSTSSCNFGSVNALNSCQLCAEVKERGRGKYKRQWGIEMNEARRLHLSTHGKIDTMDALIQNCCMFYRSWKCWHAPMTHGKAMGLVVACDVCKECTEGKLEQGWKQKPVSFHRFREKLAKQMLAHDPRERKCAGDEFFRVATQQPKSRRKSPARSPGRATASDASVASASTVTGDMLDAADGRLCGDLTRLVHHIKSVQPLPGKKRLVCCVCGQLCGHMCTICKKNLHKPSEKGEVHCFVQWHNTLFYGLAKDDSKMMGARKRDFVTPTEEAIRDHGEAIKRLRNDSPMATALQATNRCENEANRRNNSTTNVAGSNNGDNTGNGEFGLL